VYTILVSNLLRIKHCKEFYCEKYYLKNKILKNSIKKTLANGNQRWRWGAWIKTYKFQYCITILCYHFTLGRASIQFSFISYLFFLFLTMYYFNSLTFHDFYYLLLLFIAFFFVWCGKIHIVILCWDIDLIWTSTIGETDSNHGLILCINPPFILNCTGWKWLKN